MIHLGNLKPAAGATHKKKRVGRGYGSGHGKTAARGCNGQRSRSGYSGLRAFEGGQMPLIRRLPKRGFTNIFKKEYNIVNVALLETLGQKEVTPEILVKAGLLHNKKAPVKILGNGDIKKKIKVHAHMFSKTALEKIQKAGGEAIVLKGE